MRAEETELLSESMADPVDEGYTGPATVTVAGRELPVQVRLCGYFEPIDGRFHWSGRLADDAELVELVGTARAPAMITTPHGTAAGEIGGRDLWGRYRITGVGRPPMAVAQLPRN